MRRRTSRRWTRPEVRSLFPLLFLIRQTFAQYGEGSFQPAPYVPDILHSQVIEPPRVQCGETRIKISINTNEPFGGNVYAKGYFDRDICRVQGNGVGNSANITIPINADCGMRRRRIINPKGIVLEMTIIVMFHKRFLTLNDRAYHIECVYMEMTQRVTHRIDVSMNPPSDLAAGKTTLPKCRYDVLTSETGGRPVAFATIGQKVYHKWSCDMPPEGTLPQERLYCLTVHSCEVDDGHGHVQRLLDADGCSMDRTLLDEIEYKGDLEAGRESFVFKFADLPTVFFGCQLRLQLKGNFGDVCQRTSDKCRTRAAPSVTDYPTAAPSGPYIAADALAKGNSLNEIDTGAKLLLNGTHINSTRIFINGTAPSSRLSKLLFNGTNATIMAIGSIKEKPVDPNRRGIIFPKVLDTTSGTLMLKKRTRSPWTTLATHEDVRSETPSAEDNAEEAVSTEAVLSDSGESLTEVFVRSMPQFTTMAFPRMSDFVPSAWTTTPADPFETGTKARESSSTPGRLDTTMHQPLLDQTLSLPRPDPSSMDPTSDFNVDVNAPGVDVIDIPELPMQHDQMPRHDMPRMMFDKDIMGQQQVCVSRQSLTLVAASAILFLITLAAVGGVYLFRNMKVAQKAATLAAMRRRGLAHQRTSFGSFGSA